MDATPKKVTMSAGSSFLNWILPKLFKYRDILKEVEGQPSLYLRRYFLFRTKAFPNFRLFLHFINRSDDDRHLHDHPWDFTTLILSGGYREVIKLNSKMNTERVMKPGMLRFNKAEHTHKVELISGPTWSLVRARKARRVWGFHTESGWVDWRSYLGLDKHHPDSPEDEQ